MNKYQRKKVKRMKKLASLGVSYQCQKYIMRNYDLKQVDKMIEQVTAIKKSGILEKTAKALKIIGQAFKTVLQSSKKGKETLKHPERINLRM